MVRLMLDGCVATCWVVDWSPSDGNETGTTKSNKKENKTNKKTKNKTKKALPFLFGSDALK